MARGLQKRWPKVIALRFEMTEEATFIDLRFDATSLLALTDHMPMSTLMRIELQCSDPSIQEEQKFEIDLADIQLNAIASFGPLVTRSPEALQEALPRVWMNGFGQVRQFESLNDSIDIPEEMSSSHAVIYDQAENVLGVIALMSGPKDRGSLAEFLSNLCEKRRWR